MWGVPGSHKQPPNQYMVRKRDPKTGKLFSALEPLEPTYKYSKEGAVPLEVPPGSVVLLHGNFLHFSEKNINKEKQRHAYTLHIVESANGVKYKEENWLLRDDFKVLNLSI